MTAQASPGVSGFAEHNHDACRRRALAQAERVCGELGLQLTPLRRRVLELVWADHRPSGAYDLLDRLAAERGPVKPPTVYRALDFLAAAGLVHRLDSLNAFIGCAAPLAGHRALFMICRSCRNAVEIEDRRVTASLDASADAAGFSIDGATVELVGRCRDCAGLPTA